MEQENPFPARKYHLIYADPAWEYDNKKSGGSWTSGASQKYQTMSVAELCALPVPAIAAKDCVLAMWVATPLNMEAYEVWKAWGFTYKTKVYWDKLDYGTGWWFRGQVEELWIGVKGKPIAFHDQQRNVIRERSKEHSRKPGQAYTMLEAQGIPKPWIELFTRDRRYGWDAWGNQVSSTSQTMLTINGGGLRA